MIRLLLKLLASVALIAAVLWWVDGAAVAAHLRDLSPGWMIASIAFLTAATASMARRWQVVAAHLGLSLGYRAAVREYYIGTLVNQVVPGGVTGDIARAVRVRHGADLRSAALSVALERLLGQVAIFGTLAVGLTAALVVPEGIAWGALAALVPIGLLALAGASLLLTKRAGRAGRITALALTMQRRPELLFHAGLTCACLIFAFYACARATGTAIPPEGWATLIPMILVAMLVPLSIGGWGWREGAAAALFPLIGAEPGAGVAAGLAYGAAILIAALPAALIFLGQAEPTPFHSSTEKGSP